jgi:hypothetical protein
MICFQLRRSAGVPDDFVDEGWGFDSLSHSGAKGGCLIAFLESNFVVKELSRTDHESLLRISSSYFEHVTQGETLLSGIFLHFEDTATSRKFFAMRNVVGSGPFTEMYDLKGCNDDRALQLNGERIAARREAKAAASSRILVTEIQRQEVMCKLQRDTEWLTSHELMDYSLLVGIRDVPTGYVPEPNLGQTPLLRSCADGTEVVVFVGIIDFLQPWNTMKKVARAIKVLAANKATIPPKAYASRFCNHFENQFVFGEQCAGTDLSRASTELLSDEESDTISDISADESAYHMPETLVMNASGSQTSTAACDESDFMHMLSLSIL